MKETIAQIKAGLYMATQSFSMLWYQKKFLVYLGSLALINISFKLLVSNAQTGIPFFSLFGHMQNYLASLPLWLQPIVSLLALLINNSLTIFFTVALLHHIADTMRNQESSIKANFGHAIAKLNLIISWAMLSTVLEQAASYLIDKAASMDHSSNPLISMLMILVLLATITFWLLATFFVLPLLATEQGSLLHIIRSGASTSWQSISLIAGGEYWFLLIIVLVSTPFLLIWLMAQHPIINPTLFVLGLLCAEIIVKCWIATAHSIFKMMLLQNQKTQAPDTNPA
jgi:hypothetical protein